MASLGGHRRPASPRPCSEPEGYSLTATKPAPSAAELIDQAITAAKRLSRPPEGLLRTLEEAAEFARQEDAIKLRLENALLCARAVLDNP
jgi:hypothetical protein